MAVQIQVIPKLRVAVAPRAASSESRCAAVGSSLTIVTGIPGAKGEKGDSGSQDQAMIAGALLSALQIVSADNATTVLATDPSSAPSARAAIGIALNAAAGGAPVSVRTRGFLTDSSWNFTDGAAVYCGAGGVLTQTVPLTGQLLRVGTAVAPTSIFIEIRQPIQLA